MPNLTLALTPDEMSALIGAVGAMLNMMGLSVPPGQSASPEMLLLESLQEKLMDSYRQNTGGGS